jgi:SpoIIAA-like
VAVVADQAWMRVLTRLESAMLPHISYRVYELDEREEALNWARGKELVAA